MTVQYGTAIVLENLRSGDRADRLAGDRPAVALPMPAPAQESPTFSLPIYQPLRLCDCVLSPLHPRLAETEAKSDAERSLI